MAAPIAQIASSHQLRRLTNQEVAQDFFRRVLAQAKPQLSDENFTVDGTLIEASASQKSFQKKAGGGDIPGQFRGDKRSNETHESKTDPEARLQNQAWWTSEGGVAVSDDGRGLQSVASPEGPSGRSVVGAAKNEFFNTAAPVSHPSPRERD